MVTRTSGRIVPSVAKISARSRLFSALRFSGRFRVMRRTPGRGESSRM
jgi:hypothetical protein